ncbi:hypothetical protein [Streptomyces sp. ALB3]|uniref:hypothetical protein n=1 Tax=Streptomyces sp. ALB3 TaxID=3374278 RepID=UPI0037926196
MAQFVDLTGGRGSLVHTLLRRHADPQIVVTRASGSGVRAIRGLTAPGVRGVLEPAP